MGNVSMEARDINYRGGETKMSVEDALKSTSGEAAAIAALQEAVGNLQTDTGNLQTTKANLITIAPVFSEETAYDPGDLVYYNGLTYRCVNAHEGEWDADDFAATTISNELDALKSGLTNIGTTLNGSHNTDIISVDTATATDLGSVALTAGKWLLIATIDWASNGTGYRQIAFRSALNPARDGATTTVALTDTGKETYHQISRVYEVATTETVTLYGYQTSGVAIDAMPYIMAIKISA